MESIKTSRRIKGWKRLALGAACIVTVTVGATTTSSASAGPASAKRAHTQIPTDGDSKDLPEFLKALSGIRW